MNATTQVTLTLTEPSFTWYLAEGYTGGSFDEWVLLMNPNSSQASVTVEYFTPGGTNNQTLNYFLDPNSRFTIHVDEIPGLESTDVSVKVTSDVPIIAERAMYWDAGGAHWADGHVSVGVSQ